MAVPHVREVEATASRFLGCERREVTVGQAQGGLPEADLEEGGGGRVDGGVVRDGEDDGAARHRAGETADDLAAAPGRRGDSVGGEEDAVVGAEVLDETGAGLHEGGRRGGVAAGRRQGAGDLLRGELGGALDQDRGGAGEGRGQASREGGDDVVQERPRVGCRRPHRSAVSWAPPVRRPTDRAVRTASSLEWTPSFL